MVDQKSISSHAKSLLALALTLILMTLGSCDNKSANMNSNIDIQGHRGCRGLRPENTIVAFKKAMDIGVNTLELDVVVNKFHDVIISHEPFFNHEIATGPRGEIITEESEKEYNMYPMSIEEIQSFDVGIKHHSKFPAQKKVKAIKPSLREMVEEIEAYAKKENLTLPEYNIEIKRVKEHDGVYHPEMKVFADAVCTEVNKLGIAKRSTIQCFDMETLQYVHKRYPEFRLVLLIANQVPYEENISKLGFKPWAYSPYFQLVTNELVKYGKKENIKVIPWTVNEPTDIVNMIEIGVDGIISDYPDRVVELIAASES